MSEPEPEQITAPPKEEKPIKVKDPKKVAAGKALAEKNRKAREAQKRLEEMDNDSASSFTINGVMQAAAVVGAGFTLYQGWSVIKPYLTNRKIEPYETPVETRFSPPKEIPTPKKEKNKVKEIDME